MAAFDVYRIGRSGRTTRSRIHAKNKREARRIADSRFDDVLKIKRAASDVGVVVVIAIIAAAILAYYFFV